jgi:hypothetical protein
MLAEMRSPRRILAVLERALAVRDGDRCGVALAYRASARREPALPILDFLDLRPGEHVESALGLAKLLRLLREARLASAGHWLGDPEAAARRLARAVGREFRLEVVPRSRVHFEAWTEEGPLAVSDVSEVSADESAFLVRRVGARAPIHVERALVVRRHTTLERWLEVRSVTSLARSLRAGRRPARKVARKPA